MHISDREHVEQCRNGNPNDFRFLVERYQGAVFAFAASRLNDRTLARDVAEESFVRAFFALPTLKKPESFHAWILGIAGRVALEFRRAQQRRVEVPGAEAAPAEDHAEERSFRLDEAIASLSEVQRHIVLLRYFDHLSCREIADRLDMPLGTVTKTLSRAYRELRAILETQSQPETTISQEKSE